MYDDLALLGDRAQGYPNGIIQTVKNDGRNHSLFILNGMQTNTTQHRLTQKSIK